MKTLYLDTFSGISGDMLLGLLVDLGVSLDALLDELNRLPVSGYQVTATPEQRHGIGGTRVKVSCSAPQPHRRWTDIDRMLAESDLKQGTRELARRTFRLLGDAEASVH
ncbi:MAG: TIGR00299 family protein, partial [Desulfuromonas sp.]